MATPSSASFRSLVLPREHGSWSLALEPVALGLLVAPSVAGACLAGAVVAGFFARRPLKLSATLPGAEPRRQAALRWLALLSVLALLALLGAAGVATRATALWPLALAVPFGAAFLWFDLRNEMREAEAEFAGSIAFAVVPAAFATLDGWTAGQALALAALMLARSVPTVLTVRSYLRIAKGKGGAAAPAIALAAFTLLGCALLNMAGLIPALACAPIGLLTIRTFVLLSPFAPAWSARRIGITEAVLGAMFVGSVAWAYQAQ